MVEERLGERKISGFLGGVARTLNTGGWLLVRTYDLAAYLTIKTVDVTGDVANRVYGKAREILPGGSRPREKEERGPQSEKVTELVSIEIREVREYEEEIERLKRRIEEMSAPRLEETKKEKPRPARKGDRASEAVRMAIDKAVRYGEFDSESQREIFKEIADDLLDEDTEVQAMAAAKLGKMGIKSVADVLLEAVKFDNIYLTAEIINSLTNMGDSRALSLCKEMIKSPNHRLRISSLRGLYKMGTDEEIAPYLIEALKDEHPEVRRTAVTFLGWKNVEGSIPGLIQVLKDEDESVRKAAVTALSNIRDTSAVPPLMEVLSDESIDTHREALEALRRITDEEISFDLNLSGEELTDAINALKEWWEGKRTEELTAPEATPAVEGEAAEREPLLTEEGYEVETPPEETAAVESESAEREPPLTEEGYEMETPPEETA